jgi:hypothetical protein
MHFDMYYYALIMHICQVPYKLQKSPYIINVFLHDIKYLLGPTLFVICSFSQIGYTKCYPSKSWNLHNPSIGIFDV